MRYENFSLKDLGERIAWAREIKGISKTELSYQLEKSHSYIGKLESGQINISLLALLELCDSLGVTIHELID